MMRWDILNHLIQKNNYKTYLEIGYYKGWSFDRVNCKSKIAIDPFPCKTPEQEAAPKGAIIIEDLGKSEEFTDFSKFKYIHKISSDEYFEKFHSAYDLIFIDGLHEAHQVSRDIRNALKHLNLGGTIVLHDCNPPLLKHTTTGIDGCWTGDTFFAVIDYYTFEPNISYCTIDTDWGVGIIQPKQNYIPDQRIISLPPKEQLLRELPEKWEIFDKNRKELLNLISPQEFLEKF